MSDAWNEDEWVAAFLDGRLDERERAEMLARLAADDEAYQHFAATAAILHEAEAARETGGSKGEDGSPGAPAEEEILGEAGPAGPLRRAGTDAALAPETDRDDGVIDLRSRRPPPVLRWLALAAGIAALALAGRALWPRTSSAGDPVRLAARLERADAGLPQVWNQPPPWSSPRGDDQGGAVTSAARAARAGALLVDLSVAVRGRDAARTRLLAEQITSRFDPQADRTGARREFSEGAGGPPERLEPLVEQATDRIARRLGREALELGAWTEAARLAAARHDARFFRDRATRPMLDRLASRAAADAQSRAAVERVRLLLAEAGPPPWDALALALDGLAREIASG